MTLKDKGWSYLNKIGQYIRQQKVLCIDIDLQCLLHMQPYFILLKVGLERSGFEVDPTLWAVKCQKWGIK